MPKKSKQEGVTSKQPETQPASQLTTIEVHPKLAQAIASLKKHGPEELKRIKELECADLPAPVRSTGCWISDSGGQQHCVNLPPDVCTREGGISVPTRCPNA